MTTPPAGPCPCTLPSKEGNHFDALTHLEHYVRNAIESAPKTARKPTPERIKRHLLDLQVVAYALEDLRYARDKNTSPQVS